MVVVSDIANASNIHPRNKQDVGVRLNNIALAKTYGWADGLICKGENRTQFLIAGKERQFVEAEAVFEGETIVVSSLKVNNPVAVRLGWENTV